MKTHVRTYRKRDGTKVSEHNRYVPQDIKHEAHTEEYDIPTIEDAWYTWFVRYMQRQGLGKYQVVIETERVSRMHIYFRIKLYSNEEGITKLGSSSRILHVYSKTVVKAVTKGEMYSLRQDILTDAGLT